MPQPHQPKKLPEKKFGPFVGGVGVAIWVNDVQTDHGIRQFRSVTIAPRRYFDRETNQWKDASSYTPADLPGLIYALSRALDYVTDTPLEGPEAQDNGGASAPPAPTMGEVPF